MTLLNIVNTGDIKILKERVQALTESVRLANENVEITEQHLNRKTVEANMFATMARSLAKKYNVSADEMKRLRAESRRICEEDLKNRGFKQFYEQPPNFVLK